MLGSADLILRQDAVQELKIKWNMDYSVWHRSFSCHQCAWFYNLAKATKNERDVLCTLIRVHNYTSWNKWNGSFELLFWVKGTTATHHDYCLSHVINEVTRFRGPQAVRRARPEVDANPRESSISQNWWLVTGVINDGSQLTVPSPTIFYKWDLLQWISWQGLWNYLHWRMQDVSKCVSLLTIYYDAMIQTQRGTIGCLVQLHLCGLNTVDMLSISKCKELQLHQQAHLHGKAKHTVWFNGCLYLSNLQILTKLTNCLPRPTYWQAKTRFLIHERRDKVHDPQ